MRSWPLERYELEIGAVSKSPRETRRALFDEFEMCPDRVPGVDTRRQVALINLETILVQGADHKANRVAKVRNVQCGSQTLSYYLVVGH
jgi:hypothetical protein